MSNVTEMEEEEATRNACWGNFSN